MSPRSSRAPSPGVRKVDKSEVKALAGLDPYQSRLGRLKKSGNGYKTNCPFHTDRNPSFSLYKEGGDWRFRCFGCEVSGDVIEFVMKKDELGFREALKTIMDECMVETKQDREQRKSATDTKSQADPLAEGKIKFNADEAAAALASNEAARTYLATRGISQEAAQSRGLGVFDFPGMGACVAIPYATGDAKFRALHPQAKGNKFRAIGSPNDKLYGIESIDDNPFANKLLIVESELDQITASEHLDPFEFAVVSVSSATASIRGGELALQPD